MNSSKYQSHAAWSLYTYFTDFIVKFDMYGTDDIEQFEELLSRAGLSREYEAACGQFIAQLKHFRQEGISL